MEAALTSKGQITIPKAIRQHLKLQRGDRVKFFIREDGSVVIRPTVPVTALRGILRWHGPPATIEEMDEAAAAGAIARALKPEAE